VTTTLKKMTVLAVVAAAFVAPTAAHAATTTITSPFQDSVPACNGDPIQLSGRLLTVVSATLNAAGGGAFAIHFQPQGVFGLDSQTWTTYTASGLTREVVIVAAAGTTTFTVINRFRLEAMGRAQSLDASATLHFTILADGTVTASVGNFTVPCS
jgi:hypothetical protein